MNGHFYMSSIFHVHQIFAEASFTEQVEFYPSLCHGSLFFLFGKDLGGVDDWSLWIAKGNLFQSDLHEE